MGQSTHNRWNEENDRQARLEQTNDRNDDIPQDIDVLITGWVHPSELDDDVDKSTIYLYCESLFPDKVALDLKGIPFPYTSPVNTAEANYGNVYSGKIGILRLPREGNLRNAMIWSLTGDFSDEPENYCNNQSAQSVGMSNKW